MNKKSIITQLGASIILAMLGLFCVLTWLSGWPPKIHGLILGFCAFVFGFSERLFWNILSELNATLRSNNLALATAEKFRAIIQPFKRRLWRRWVIMTALQLVAAASATLILSGLLGPVDSIWLLVAGYGSVFMTVPILVSFFVNYIKIDSIRDDLALGEIQRNTAGRLLSELGSSPAEYQRDPQLEGYTAAPEH